MENMIWMRESVGENGGARVEGMVELGVGRMVVCDSAGF